MIKHLEHVIFTLWKSIDRLEIVFEMTRIRYRHMHADIATALPLLRTRGPEEVRAFTQ